VRLFAGAIALASLGALAAPAHAQRVTVAAQHCPELEAIVASALELELAGDPRVVAEFELRVDVPACDADRWTLRVTDADGAHVSGPQAIAMEAFAPGTRARIAALWAVDHIPERAGLAAALAAPSPERSAPEAERARARPRLVVDAGAGFVAFLGPAQVGEYGVVARVGLRGELLDWLLIGGSLEGGAIFEPFGHVQPVVRLCGDPRAEIDAHPIRIQLGPKFCIDTSRHIVGLGDAWTAGVGLGGFVRGSIAIADGYSLAIRADAEAWDRDIVVDPGRLALPWIGAFAVALELDAR
jgi:hypothetical protein